MCIITLFCCAIIIIIIIVVGPLLFSTGVRCMVPCWCTLQLEQRWRRRRREYVDVNVGGGGSSGTFEGADGARGTDAAAAAAAVARESSCRRRAPRVLRARTTPCRAVGGDTRPRPQPAIGATRGRFNVLLPQLLLRSSSNPGRR